MNLYQELGPGANDAINGQQALPVDNYAFDSRRKSQFSAVVLAPVMYRCKRTVYISQSPLFNSCVRSGVS